MKLSKIRIKNYRLLVDAEIEVSSDITLLVGRNNTAKTSFFSCISNAIKGKLFSFNDYPLHKREKLYQNISNFMENKITFSELLNYVEPITVEFLVDYSLDGLDDDLGALSPFIIDVDDDITTALIKVEFKLKNDERALYNLLNKFYYKDCQFDPDKDTDRFIGANFKKMFEMTVYAVNPNNLEEKQKKEQKELSDLFPLFIIPAERTLGEDTNQNNSLTSLITEYFDVSEDKIDPSVIEEVKNLRNIIEEANLKVQQQSDNMLSEIINKSIEFGYPNVEELQLGVTTQLSIDDQIKNNTILSYSLIDGNDKLPSSYNGLGYKNLIKMEFLFAAFARNIESGGVACIPIIFVEEPESHMHPQMQQAFAKYVDNFFKKITNHNIQLLITTHSSHIANTIDFSKIRYAQKSKMKVIYKNLNDFALKNSDNVNFIRKYLTLTKCDLFFADKAIFVEGASERLLIPDMIDKCNKLHLFDTDKYNLSSQYYTIVEVGGAYAYKFIPFIEFLGIPSLILTDLDSAKSNMGKDNKIHYSRCYVSEGTTTTNETIKRWFRKKKGIDEDDKSIVNLKDIIALTDEEKTTGKCHIEFQTLENDLCGHSLEEAIINVNRSYYKLKGEVTEEKIEFKPKKGRSKTDFAFDLIYDCEDYNIPNYIKSGLIWISKQKVLSKRRCN